MFVEHSIPRRNQAGPCRLSLGQERLWFLNQLKPDSAAYNQPRAIRLRGALSVDALKQSLEEIVARHESLRTTFVSLDGEPFQMINSARPIELPLIDLSRATGEYRQAELDRAILAITHHPFDLSKDLMLRAALFYLGENHHVLLLVTYHIASDGWSMEVLFQELAALYSAFAAGQPCALSELPIQYADFAIWQRNLLQGEFLESQLLYWKEQLSGSLPSLQLPRDHARPIVESDRGGVETLLLPGTLVSALKDLSRQNRVTLFITLLAAFKTLLFRYTSQEDVLVGVPIANRTRPEMEPLIGFFINNLVMRTDLGINPTFLQLLSRVRDVAFGAYAHQDLPFERVVEEINPDRSVSRNPLFQVAFNLLSFPRQEIRLPGLALTELAVHNHRSKFDLTLTLMPKGQDLSATFEYSTDLLDASTIRRMLFHFKTLLQGIAVNAGERIAHLPLLTDAERKQLLIHWNATREEYPNEKCLHQLFEEQAARTPDSVAVIFENRQLTYRELNVRANKVAHHLQKLGVGPETLVGICVERSLDMVVGLLGILKAGGAYVPLDPEYPKQRLAFMLEDAQVLVLLTQRRVLENGIEDRRSRADGEARFSLFDPQIHVICLDSDWEVIEQRSGENLDKAAAENLAYVIYTSGSTGKPKGVQVQHRALVNLLRSMRQQPGLTAKDTFVAVTTLSFDIAGMEIFLPLSVGARVVLSSSDVSRDGTKLAALLETSNATVMQATPATWQLLMEADWRIPEHFKVLCGGEEPTRELAAYLLERTSSVWNMYGPTETTVWSAIERLESARGAVPIGRPIGNTQIYILDRYLQPVPVGVHGEIHIGGTGVARGYKNRPELVAEKFIPDLFGGEKGGRLYKTGDRARFLSNGKIEFLGRIDYQTKLRGFRIELGEIEAVLARHYTVMQAIVAVKEISGDRRLISYLVTRDGEAPNSTALRDFLRTELPEYMVPSSFVFLEKIPRTPNGKVDRMALPVPEVSGPDLARGFVKPRNPVEETIAGIWAEVLKRDAIGIHDNFFDLGGHSLLAMRIISKVLKTFQEELSVRLFFEGPTVAGLAKLIETLRCTRQNQPASIESSGDYEHGEL
jgi:amino acid adenylation domain-containing protein